MASPAMAKGCPLRREKGNPFLPPVELFTQLTVCSPVVHPAVVSLPTKSEPASNNEEEE